MDDIYVWLKLCRRAARLPACDFALWSFMVGTGGTISERTLLGKRALAVLGVSWDLQISKEEPTHGPE